MANFIFRETRLINASDAEVYDIIAGLDHYAVWNPWIISARGDITPGSAVTVRARMYGMPTTFKHLMIAAERPARFHWCDTGWFTLFVNGERERTIERIDDGHCRYTCELRVSGPGAVFANLLFGKFMRNGLKSEADALKYHAEYTLLPEFTGETIEKCLQEKITAILNGIQDKRLRKTWKRVEVKIYSPVEKPVPVDEVHKVWNTDHVANVKSPGGLSCLPTGEPCPPGCRLIEVSYISRLSGGMGSYYQFDGYFVSAILSPDGTRVLDARIEKAY